MDLCPTDDQLIVTTSAADYLRREYPADRMPRQTATAIGADAWRGLAEMGWFGLGLDPAIGGLGLSAIEEALLLREFGRHLMPPSCLATILAGHVAAAAGDAALVAALTEGRRRAGFAIPAGQGEGDADYHLLDSDGADLFLLWTPSEAVLVGRDGFASVVRVEGLDAAIETEAARGLDPMRIVARADIATFEPRARVLTAAMLVGGAEATRDISADYARTREQFGRPIGEFQAISHRCARMAVDGEAALALLHYAAICVRDEPAEAANYAAAARLVAAEAARNAAANAMQIFGGYGQTYDYLPHFYLKRAHIYGVLGGGTDGDGRRLLDATSML